MFFGIDESNHGRFPEIYVGLFSPYFFDAINLRNDKTNESLSKQRKSKIEIPSHISGWYLKFNENFARKFGKNNLMIVSVLEILKKVHPLNLEKLIIDGNLSEKSKLRLQFKLDELNYDNAQIIIEGKADITYPIVNLADYLAYQTFSQVSKHKKALLPQIKPSVKEYEWLLD